MTTIDDQASDREELDRELAKKQRKPELAYTGKCHWCEESTARAFCSAECMEDWEKKQRFNKPQ